MSRYREVSAEVFKIFRESTPEVEGLSLDEAFLDVTGSLAVPTASTEVVFKQARALLKIWLLEHQNTPVRLLGVGVAGLEVPDARGIEYDSETQKALDKTLDEIKRRYGDDKATYALALRTDKKSRD